MPCQSSYMEPNPQEKESKEVAEHLVYVFRSLGEKIPEYVKESCRDYYGGVKYLNRMTAILCKVITEMEKVQLDIIVYDGRNPDARALADWWDYHQKRDMKREEEEKTQAQNTMLKKSGLAKLTSQERKALGL